MEKNTEIRGVKIDKEVLTMVEKSADRAGSFRKLAIALHLNPTSISRWRGTIKGKSVDCIDWPVWENLWQFMVKEKILPADDTKYIPPSVMRQKLDEYQRRIEKLDKENGLSMSDFGKLIDKILTSDMCSECKIKAYNILKETQPA